MRSKNETTIKIVLIGDKERKRAFVNAFNNGHNKILGTDFINIPSLSGKMNYQLWDLIGHEDFRLLTGVCIKGAHAFVYLNPHKTMKNKFESKRDANQTIAIDFDALKLTPQECIMEIEDLIAAYPAEIKKQEDETNKALLILESRNDRKSHFSSLPTELHQSICQLMIASKNPVFGNSEKPVFIGLPTKVEVEENNKNKTTSEVPTDSGYTLF